MFSSGRTDRTWQFRSVHSAIAGRILSISRLRCSAYLAALQLSSATEHRRPMPVGIGTELTPFDPYTIDPQTKTMRPMTPITDANDYKAGTLRAFLLAATQAR